jgi:hypothetical protein
MECRLAGESEVLGENLLQRHFCPSQNPTWPDPVLNPGRRGGKPATMARPRRTVPMFMLDPVCRLWHWIYSHAWLWRGWPAFNPRQFQEHHSSPARPYLHWSALGLLSSGVVGALDV